MSQSPELRKNLYSPSIDTTSESQPSLFLLYFSYDTFDTDSEHCQARSVEPFILDGVNLVGRTTDQLLQFQLYTKEQCRLLVSGVSMYLVKYVHVAMLEPFDACLGGRSGVQLTTGNIFVVFTDDSQCAHKHLFSNGVD